ncbi:MAG: type II secretion system secretin GspD [bacterium]|nr:type II secretion system secretin GspD [bacterium]
MRLGRSPEACALVFLVSLAACHLTGGDDGRPRARAEFTYDIPETLPPGAPPVEAAYSGPREYGVWDTGSSDTPSSPTMTPEISYGTGNAIRDTSIGRSFEVSTTGDIVLNFVDTDLTEVAKVILADMMKVNYVVDPQVQGKVTLQTSRPIPESDLLPTLETLLELNGAALILSDDLYQIVPSSSAARMGGGLGTAESTVGRRPGFSVQVVPLDFVAPSEMAKLLGPISPSGAVLLVDDRRNLLILAGGRNDMNAMLEAVDTFDVDWLQSTSFGVFPVRYAQVGDVAEELQEILDAQAGSGDEGLIRLISIDRLNSLLVLSPQPDYLTYVQDWITRLDKVTETDEPRFFVYYVKNRVAADLAKVLNEFFIDERRGGLSGGGGEVAPQLQPAELRSYSQLGEAGPNEDVIQEQPPSGAVLRATTVETPEGRLPHNLKIMADEDNNALLTLATPFEYRTILSAIEKLDLVPPQVLIEAIIAEVSLDDELKYGVEWFLQSGDSSATFSSLAAGGISSAFPGFSYLFNSSDVRVVLNALSDVTDVRVISSPQIMVLDGRSAEIQVGDQVPIATQSAVSVLDPEAPIVNTIELFDTGVILKVTPRVNPGGLVIMEIEQEVSLAVSTTTSGIDSPTIQQRKIKSTVAIQSGEAIALGGLITAMDTIGDTGVPVLSDIPVLGHLFGTTDDKSDRMELIALITPRVVWGRDDARQVTRDLRKKMTLLSPRESIPHDPTSAPAEAPARPDSR